MAEVAAAVEDLFLRGEYDKALAESQAKLVQRTLELRQEQRDAGVEERAAPCITADEERVLSVYLQAVFELDADAEVDTAAAVVDAFAPLPTGVAVQWVKFLVAMQRRTDAEAYLRRSISSRDPALPQDTEAAQRHAALVELLTIEFELQQHGVDAARRLVREDAALDDITRLRLVGRIEERAAAVPAASDRAMSTSRDSHQLDAPPAVDAPRLGRGSCSPGSTEMDDCSYALIGGVAIAAAALGALRYRDKIHEAIAQVGPVISKSLADAKYALFDA